MNETFRNAWLQKFPAWMRCIYIPLWQIQKNNPSIILFNLRNNTKLSVYTMTLTNKHLFRTPKLHQPMKSSLESAWNMDTSLSVFHYIMISTTNNTKKIRFTLFTSKSTCSRYISFRSMMSARSSSNCKRFRMEVLFIKQKGKTRWHKFFLSYGEPYNLLWSLRLQIS